MEKLRSNRIRRTKYPQEITDDGRPLGPLVSHMLQGVYSFDGLDLLAEVPKEVVHKPPKYNIKKDKNGNDVQVKVYDKNGFVDPSLVPKHITDIKNKRNRLMSRRRLPTIDLLPEDVANLKETYKVYGLTKDRLACALAGVQAGLSAYKACRVAGISKMVYDTWLERAIKGIEPYTELIEMFDTARITYEQTLLNSIKKAGTEGYEIVEEVEGVDATGRSYYSKKVKKSIPAWQASAWVLGRSFKDTYSQNISISEMEAIENKLQLEADIAAIDYASAPEPEPDKEAEAEQNNEEY